jgi:hypothetical protein
VNPRALLPEFFQSLMLDRVPDPMLAGILPRMSRNELVNRFGLHSVVNLAQATITVNGQVSDWPPGSEALLPRDSTGDVSGYLPVAGLDGVALFLARDQTGCQRALT